MRTKRFLGQVSVVLGFVGVAFIGWVSAAAAPTEKPAGVFVLGVDGVDPVILSRLMDEGKMPHFAQLARDGTYQKLGTSIPPQSPVAWSCFVTGRNPGGHGVYDFVHRDPRTYKPISSATRPPQNDDPFFLRLFGFVVPVGGSDPQLNRSGPPFWDLLADRGIDVEVYRIPGNYPTPPSEAKVLSGMGTVDMRGGYGTYTFFTSRPPQKAKPKGDIQIVTVQDHDLDGIGDTVAGVLRGPPDLFRVEPGAPPKPSDYLSARITFHIDPVHDTVLVRLDEHVALLERGQWSDWLDVRFSALPADIVSFAGSVRVFVKQLRPHFEVYVSPVNISPAAPSQPISSPPEFATEIYDALGHYYTQGMPEETDALKDDTFSDDDYLAQVALVQQDTERMLRFALKRFEPGDFTFVYVSDIDLQCHMLWRHRDPKNLDVPRHPAYDPAVSEAHTHDIEGFYQNADRLLGIVQENLPKGTLLIVMSDHGFERQHRDVHLNAWLRDEGYLVLKDAKREGHIAKGDVDWSKTRAYALGFNALYLNLRGREGQGIVDADERRALIDELSTKLEALRDPQNGASVVRKVDRAKVVYSGERLHEAPDLIVGYEAGYGGSDENTLGEVAEPVIVDNTRKWSGNHLMSADVVPGVLLLNRPLGDRGHNLTDVTVSVLDHYGIPKDDAMVGRSFFGRR